MELNLLGGAAALASALVESRRLARPVRVEPPAAAELEGDEAEIRLAWDQGEEVFLLVVVPEEASKGIRIPTEELGLEALLLEEMKEAL